MSVPYRSFDDLPVLRRVRTPRPVRAPARTVAILIAIVTVALAVTPWVQTAYGEGRVIAFSPSDREQRIEAPIEGRIGKWHVVEGSVVKEGDPIVDLVDNDPQILVRLRAERDAVQRRLEASEGRKKAAEAKIKAVEASQRAATTAAKVRVKMASDRVAAAKKAVEASAAAEKTAKLNLVRQKALVEKGIVSQRAWELADLDFAKTSTDLARAEAALALAKSDTFAIESDRLKIEADTAGSIEDARASIASATSEVAKALEELAKIEVRLARQGAMSIKAPRAGTILRVVSRGETELLKAGDELAVLVPAVTDRAVELWVDGRDVPLLRVGSEVRLQFEGWPALQFSGWPSVAVGTFGGRVAVVDATDDGKGKFRVVINPSPDEAWPDAVWLRQGVRVHGWALLGKVPLGYELWRQFNGFPPAIAPPTTTSGTPPTTMEKTK